MKTEETTAACSASRSTAGLGAEEFEDSVFDPSPCPCCGDDAAFCVVDDDGLIDGRAGGWFIECNNPMCGITTQLVFATGDDPRTRLLEVWNKRAPNGEVQRPAAKGE